MGSVGSHLMTSQTGGDNGDVIMLLWVMMMIMMMISIVRRINEYAP